MPNQAKKPYRNLLELLESTESYTADAFKACFKGKDQDGAAYASTINDRLAYSLHHQPKRTFEAYPIQFAIERRLFHRIQFLYEHGATHEIRGYQAFATLVSVNAPLELLHYCMQHDKCHHDEKYPALLAAYRQADRPLEKFEAIHHYCFGLSFEAILLEQKPLMMSPAEFERLINAYSLKVAQGGLLNNELKAIYLDIIKHNHHYKSHLKTKLVFGKENPVVNFLRTNPVDATMSDTAHFHALQAILKTHQLLAHDVINIRLQLNRENKANQALAGLYFAYYDFSDREDYALFSKNLVIPRETYDQYAQRNFERLLKNYLNNNEMKKLKENCLRSLENDINIKQDFKREMDNQLAKSPMGTIIRTGTTTRKEKHTGTLAKAMRFCLFSPKLEQGHFGQHEDYVNILPAYNPAYVQP